MHFSAGAPTTDMEPVNTLLSADTMRIIAQQQDIENTRRHTQNTNTRYQYLMVMGTKYCITTLSFPADITESRIKKNENSLTAERWLFSQIKASRPFVGQYICHCILSPIVWIRKSAIDVCFIRPTKCTQYCSECVLLSLQCTMPGNGR